MTEPGIIRRNGVEYEECMDCHGNGCIDPVYICIRPKRVQTGWICRGGANGNGCPPGFRCVREWSHGDSGCKMDRCPRTDFVGAKWEPYYGKVVE